MFQKWSVANHISIMQLFARTPEKIFTFDLDDGCTVAALKQSICDRSGLASEEQVENRWFFYLEKCSCLAFNHKNLLVATSTTVTVCQSVSMTVSQSLSMTGQSAISITSLSPVNHSIWLLESVSQSVWLSASHLFNQYNCQSVDEYDSQPVNLSGWLSLVSQSINQYECQSVNQSV